MIAMAAHAVENYCRRFQPNSFDPSRCSSCLRPRRMHVTGIPAAPAAADEDSEDFDNDDDANGGQWDGSQYWVRT